MPVARLVDCLVGMPVARLVSMMVGRLVRCRLPDWLIVWSVCRFGRLFGWLYCIGCLIVRHASRSIGLVDMLFGRLIGRQMLICIGLSVDRSVDKRPVDSIIGPMHYHACQIYSVRGNAWDFPVSRSTKSILTVHPLLHNVNWYILGRVMQCWIDFILVILYILSIIVWPHPYKWLEPRLHVILSCSLMHV